MIWKHLKTLFQFNVLTGLQLFGKYFNHVNVFIFYIILYKYYSNIIILIGKLYVISQNSILISVIFFASDAATKRKDKLIFDY